MPLLKKKQPDIVREFATEEDLKEVKDTIKKPAADTPPTIITQEQLIISQQNYMISLLESIKVISDYIKAKTDEV